MTPPEDWQHIAADIKAHYDEYDGFVILHGTDNDGVYRIGAPFMLENLVNRKVIAQGHGKSPLAELRRPTGNTC